MTWHAEANCLGVDPDVFFPERGDTEAYRTAVAICQGCPVTDQCLAENAWEKDGVYGGLSGRQRRRWRKEAGIGRPCLHCGTSFRPYSDLQLMCSPECKKARHAEVKAESALRAWWSE